MEHQLRALSEPVFEAVKQRLLQQAYSPVEVDAVVSDLQSLGLSEELLASLRSSLADGTFHSVKDITYTPENKFTVVCSIPYESINLESESYNCFVGDLPMDVTEDDLKEAFSVCGTINEARVIRDRVTGNCKERMEPDLITSHVLNLSMVTVIITANDNLCSQLGYGFLHFATPEALATALGLEFGTIKVKGRSARVRSSEQKTVLHIGNLPFDFTGDEVRDAVFSALAPVMSVQEIEFKPQLNREGRTRGTAYANFPTNSRAEAAKKILGATSINGKALSVAWGESIPAEDDEQSKSTTVYISNLITSLKEDVLRVYCQQFGDVTRLVLPRQPHTGEHKGYAFVTFSERSACDLAINELHETEFMGAVLNLSIAKPPSDKSKKMLPPAVPNYGYMSYPYAGANYGSYTAAPYRPQQQQQPAASNAWAGYSAGAQQGSSNAWAGYQSTGYSGYPAASSYGYGSYSGYGYSGYGTASTPAATTAAAPATPYYGQQPAGSRQPAPQARPYGY